MATKLNNKLEVELVQCPGKTLQVRLLFWLRIVLLEDICGNSFSGGELTGAGAAGDGSHFFRQYEEVNWLPLRLFGVVHRMIPPNVS